MSTRLTRQGAVITALLRRSNGFRSAQDLYTQLRREGHNIGLATVYRHLQALASAHAIDTLRTLDGETLYRLCATESHHHHLICQSCGRAEEVAAPVVEAWAEQVARAAGFRQSYHTLEITGICAACDAGPGERQ